MKFAGLLRAEDIEDSGAGRVRINPERRFDPLAKLVLVEEFLKGSPCCNDTVAAWNSLSMPTNCTRASNVSHQPTGATLADQIRFRQSVGRSVNVVFAVSMIAGSNPAFPTIKPNQ
jgi:hypothetical protein